MLGSSRHAMSGGLRGRRREVAETLMTPYGKCRRQVGSFTPPGLEQLVNCSLTAFWIVDGFVADGTASRRHVLLLEPGGAS